MSETPESSPEQKKSRINLSNTFTQLLIVVAVGIVIATLFTGYPLGLVPENNEQSLPTMEILPTQEQPVVNTPTQEINPPIGIVSGHWGSDSGAACDNGLVEAEVNQTIATLVQKQLITLGYEVDLLKEFDPKLKDYRASALVSIHADSCKFINDEATGFKVATALARSNREDSTRLAACIRNRYAHITQLPHHSTSLTPDMTSYHAFAEIDIDTPAAIIEAGFLNLDQQFLTEHPDIAAQGIVSGILCFLNNESISPTATPLSQ